MTENVYPVHFKNTSFHFDHTWTNEIWRDIPHLEVNQFRPESSDFRPRTQVKLVYNNQGLLVFFMVKDRYVVCRHHHFQDPVYKDSCVEFFLQPQASKGYFNFEFNCGGAFLANYITNPARVPSGFKEFTPLTPEDGRKINIKTSQPPVILEEIADDINWQLVFFIPFDLLQKYAGPIKVSPGQIFRANFFKCADACSHPHWAAWSSVDHLNFHLPHCFGTLQLL